MNCNFRLALGAALLLIGSGCGQVTGNPVPRYPSGGARSELQAPHREAPRMTADRGNPIEPGFGLA